MADKTGIEWTDATWNPVTGCTKVSAGCDRCYAETFAERWRGTLGHPYENGFDLQLRPKKLDQPLRWTRPRRIFVNSMSDLFHDQVPDDYIARVFAIMAHAGQHTFQVLTKRHSRMRSLLSDIGFQSEVGHEIVGLSLDDDGNRGLPKQILDANADYADWWPLRNVWLGVSAENQRWANIRIPALLDTPAAVRFVSAEPLLGPITLEPLWLSPPVSLQGTPTIEDQAVLARFCREQADKSGGWFPFLDWVIVGGESGRGARPMHPQWARDIRDQCRAAGVPFLFKQWGEYRPAQPGVDTWDQIASLPVHCDVPMVDGAEGAWADMRRVGKKAAGRELDGRTWDQYPEAVAHA